MRRLVIFALIASLFAMLHIPSNALAVIPSSPNLYFPGYGGNVSGTVVNFSWYAANGAVDYWFEMATDPNFNNIVVDGWTGGTGVQTSGLEDDGQIYYWRVWAWSYDGANVSYTWYFYNGPSAPPSTPSIVSPANGANVPGTTVTLEWTQAVRANNYYLQVATDSGFTNKIVDEWIGNYIGVYLTLPDDGTRYYWRVAAGNSKGSSLFTGSYYFTNGPSAVPVVPVPTSPGNGAYIPGTTVTIQWEPAARANDYRLQLAIDSGFSTIVFDDWLGDYIGIQFSDLPDNGQQFYWRVAAGNSLGSSSFTTGRYFTNGPSGPPSVPSLSSPQNGNNASGSTVTFYWNEAPRANDYRLQVAFDSSFNEVVFDEWVGNYIGTQLNGFQDIGDQFYWRVSARNSLGESSFPYAWYFINGPSSVPAAPVLATPTNNSNAEGYGVNFYWQASARAEYYDIQIATDINFNSIMKEEIVYGTTAYIDGFANAGQDFYWRVAGINSLGTGPYSSGFKFTNGTAQECSPVTGTGYGLLSNFYSHIDTCKDINNNYFLKDISRRFNVNPHLHNGQMKSTAEIRTELYNSGLMKDTDGNNVWDAANQKSAVDAHQHTAMVYDYFLNSSKLWSLNSFNGQGDSMTGVVETPCGDDNAYWDGNSVTYCTGVSHIPLSAALDIVAHEWGHAVTEKAATRGSELIYEKQSGALNEAFSDWIGTATNHYYGRPYWTIGEGVWVIRSLQNPKLYGQPDTYKDPSPSGYWFETDNCIPYCDPEDSRYNDCCGVHTNSGVPNKMFYLLSQGGTHNNVTVQPITIGKAIRVAVQANLEYWNAGATFVDALNGMVSATLDFYGQDSFEMNQVKNAWAAVKVSTLPAIVTIPSPAAGGTTSGGGSFEWGDVITVTASPSIGYVFKNWTENGTEISTSANYTFDVNGSRNLVANFSVVPPTISVTPTSNDFGSILVGEVSTPKTFTVTNQGSQPLVIGTAYRDGVNAAEFLKNSDGCSGQSLEALASCAIQMEFTPTSAGAKSAALEIPTNDSSTPTFQVQLTGTGVTVPVYSITATAGVGGSITPSGTVTVPSNASQTFTISPNIGFHVADVKIDGVSIGTQSSYTFSNVTANHTIEAVFAIDLFAITTSAGTGGTITPSSAMVSYGGSQSFTIAANTGYSIADVLVDGVSHGAITSYTFSNVTSGHSISATFTANACMTLPVSIVRSSFSYETLQLGYDAALDGDIIQAHGIDFSGDFNVNRNIAVTLDGGYSCDYTSKTGSTVIKGNLTITNGALVVDDLVISN